MKQKLILGLLGAAVVLVGGALAIRHFACEKEIPGYIRQYLDKDFALQADAKEVPPALVDVLQDTLDVKFVKEDGSVGVRKIRIYVPQNVSEPMPLVFIPFYEMSEDASELRTYVSHGWMVASPTCIDVQDNGTELVANSLVFNNAALYSLRRMPGVDPQRIALVGGSAGGYTALMLAGLQMSLCATIANAPVTNIYFNLKYMEEGARVDDEAIKAKTGAFPQTPDERRKGLRDIGVEAPLPILGMIADLIVDNKKHFSGYENIRKYEALSPVGIADCYNAPLVINHHTSDVLVPIDQISRKFTHRRYGKSMPKGFSTRLDKNYPGVLGRTFAEELPKDLTCLRRLDINDPKVDGIPSFVDEKAFTLNIYDDGLCEGYGGHRAGEGGSSADNLVFLETMFSRTLSQTEFLTEGKLRLLLQRYAGLSEQLPAHEGGDDSLYGSLAVYREEVIEELSRYASNHSVAELEGAVAPIIASDETLAGAWKEIREKI